MVEYTCNKCNKTFDHKSTYERHKIRQKKCDTVQSKLNKVKIDHMCNFCDKVYSRKDSLKRHITTCKNNKQNHTNIKIIGNGINNINNGNINNNGNGNINNNGGGNINNNGGNINNNGGNINNNGGNINKITNNANVYEFNGPIYIISLGKEGMKCIDSATFNKIMNSERSIIENMVKTINFNPEKPQYHNILYSNIKSPHGEVYDNDKWVKMKIDEILNTLINSVFLYFRKR